MNKATVFFAALALVACQRDLLTVDDLDVTLRPGVVVPLGALDLTLSDVFNPDSGLVTVDPDQTYRLVYRQTNLLDVGVADFLELPSQPTVAENFKAGYIALPNVNAAAAVRFGKLARSITNPAGFAAIPILTSCGQNPSVSRLASLATKYAAHKPSNAGKISGSRPFSVWSAGPMTTS